MQVEGYGEDSLTLWAMCYRLPEILKQLGDPAAFGSMQDAISS